MEGEIKFQDLFSAVWRYKIAVIVFTLLVTLSAVLVLNYLPDEEYVAVVSVELNPYQGMALEVIEMAKGTGVIRDVLKETTEKRGYLRGTVELMTASGEPDLVQVKASHPDARIAEKLAYTVGEALLDFSVFYRMQILQYELELTRKKIEQLDQVIVELNDEAIAEENGPLYEHLLNGKGEYLLAISLITTELRYFESDGLFEPSGLVTPVGSTNIPGSSNRMLYIAFAVISGFMVSSFTAVIYFFWLNSN